jgi:outer membrane lipoprotein-sorting protein
MLILLMLFAAGLCIAGTAHAASSSDPASDDALLTALAERARAVKRIESRFRQTRHISFMNEKFVSEGFFLFQSPDRITWHYEKPVPFTLEYAQKKAFLRNAFPGRETPDSPAGTSRETAFAAAVAEQILVWISLDTTKIRAAFTVQVVRAYPLSLVLRPKQKSRVLPLQKMDVEFVGDGPDMRRIILSEQDGDTLVLEFFDTRREE